MSTWEAIFSQSPVNQGYYDETRLPQFHWDWPRGTWFQSRLDSIRDHERIWIARPVSKPNIAARVEPA
jgi:hypothetical protein